MKEPKINFEAKIGWSEIIAVVALALSGIAIYQSFITRNDTRMLNKLDFRPTLALNAWLEKINDKIPAHINIENTGPVDAAQVQIQFHFLRYFPEEKKIRATAYGTEHQWTIDRLPALGNKKIEINEASLGTLLPVFSDAEKHYRILEIRLNYRRPVDLKEYGASAFYFVSKEGKWVGEQSSALNDSIYIPIKEAVWEYFNKKPDARYPSDVLHE